LLHSCEHVENVEAIREGQNSNKEYEKENPDVDKHLNYHSDKGCSLLEHSHEVEQFQPQTEDGKASYDVKVSVTSEAHQVHEYESLN